MPEIATVAARKLTEPTRPYSPTPAAPILYTSHIWKIRAMHLMTSDEPVNSTVSCISFFLFTKSLPPLPYTQVYAAGGTNFLFKSVYNIYRQKEARLLEVLIFS